MSVKPDYYKVLGVSPQATLKEIKAAYHQLAMKLHPDHGGSASALAAVNEAAEVLTDAKRREAYDVESRLDARSAGASASKGSARTPRPEPGPPRPRQKVSIALCELCDTLNRVKDDPDFVPATCGHCGRPLGKAGRPAGATEQAGAKTPPPNPEAAAADPAKPDAVKDEDAHLDSYAKLLTDTANQLFGGGLKQAARNLPGAEKILEGLQEMTEHLASRGEARKEAAKDPSGRAHEKLDEMDEVLRKIKPEGK